MSSQRHGRPGLPTVGGCSRV